ncbi:MAG TPA: MarR family winged helix-turn-helix transcriptional regulator [Microthrixaceae bacterium]|nr:MarR family winged helix-turn-helix transcriptional regulator [Microthrixaceae bacterium]
MHPSLERTALEGTTQERPAREGGAQESAGQQVNGMSATPTAGLLGSIVRLNLVVSDVLEQITSQFGLAMPDYLVLGVIRGAVDSRTSPSAITEVLGRTSGGMTLTLDRLVNSGWVRRSKDPDDGRRVVVELTEVGLDLALNVNRALHDWEESLTPAQPVEVVSEMVEALTEAISKHSVQS